MQAEKIFISGRVSGLHYDYAYQKFASANKLLEKMGYKVINPMCICHRNWSWIRCMAVCIWNLIQCDAIYMLEDWDLSKGSKIEYRIARMLKKKIIFQKY